MGVHHTTCAWALHPPGPDCARSCSDLHGNKTARRGHALLQGCPGSVHMQGYMLVFWMRALKNFSWGFCCRSPHVSTAVVSTRGRFQTSFKSCQHFHAWHRSTAIDPPAPTPPCMHARVRLTQACVFDTHIQEPATSPGPPCGCLFAATWTCTPLRDRRLCAARHCTRSNWKAVHMLDAELGPIPSISRPDLWLRPFLANFPITHVLGVSHIIRPSVDELLAHGSTARAGYELRLPPLHKHNHSKV